MESHDKKMAGKNNLLSVLLETRKAKKHPNWFEQVFTVDVKGTGYPATIKGYPIKNPSRRTSFFTKFSP